MTENEALKSLVEKSLVEIGNQLPETKLFGPEMDYLRRILLSLAEESYKLGEGSQSTLPKLFDEVFEAYRTLIEKEELVVKADYDLITRVKKERNWWLK